MAPTANSSASRLAASLLLAVLAVSGCKADVGAVDPSDLDAPTTPISLPSAESTGSTVPGVVGLTLDAAQPRLRAAGFGALSEDLLQDRAQLADKNWLVCTQDPQVGPAAPGSVVQLGVVKTNEVCPGTAQVVPTSTSAQPITDVARPRTEAAVPKAKPAPAPKSSERPIPKQSSKPTRTSEKPDEDDSGSGSSVGTVHPGSFCDPPGTGVSKTGKPMVCAPGSDGRNRWRSA